MSFLNKLFPRGKEKSPTTDLAKSARPTSLVELPLELNSDERVFDVHSALKKLTKDRLREICAILPTTELDLAAPGSSEPMKHAVQSIFLVATYVISNGVSKDIADSVIVPLVARIEYFGSACLHPQLGADEVFDLALAMSRSGRVNEALRCLDVLSETVVRLQRPVLTLKYMTLHNVAMDSGAQRDINQALAFYDATTDLHDDSNVRRGSDELRARLEKTKSVAPREVPHEYTQKAVQQAARTFFGKHGTSWNHQLWLEFLNEVRATISAKEMSDAEIGQLLEAEAAIERKRRIGSAAAPTPKPTPAKSPSRDAGENLGDKILEQYWRNGGTFGR